LKSTIPPITCPAWVSMFTGKSSGQLGLFDFFTLNENYEKRALNLTEIFKGGFLWDLVEGEGYKSGVIAVPMVEPYRTKGFMVGDWERKGEGNFEDIDLDLSKIKNSDWILTSTKLKEGIENFKEEVEIFREILNGDEELIVGVFQLSDEVIHYGNKERAFDRVYRVLDQEVGKIVSKVEENDWNLIIVSDHGAKKVHNRFNINNWLEENGYLEFKGNVGFLTRISDFISRYNTNLVRAGMRIFERFSNFFQRDKIDTSQNMALGKINFKKTKAFSVSTSVNEISGIWLNKLNKFNQGTINEKEVPRLKDEIKENLKKEKAVKNVWKREEILNQGEVNFNLPDIIIRAKENFLVGYRPMPNLYSKRRRYIHDIFGTIMGFGPDFIKDGSKVENIQIKDVSPSILPVLNSPIPRSMDGKVKEGIYSNKNMEIKSCPPIKVNEKRGMEREDEEELKRKLRELGYNA
ncbi:MAG: alkaline phosphatase family protein, partial [Candidatus Aenigmatarchaeota archaeon]